MVSLFIFSNLNSFLENAFPLREDIKFVSLLSFFNEVDVFFEWLLLNGVGQLIEDMVVSKLHQLRNDLHQKHALLLPCLNLRDQYLEELGVINHKKLAWFQTDHRLGSHNNTVGVKEFLFPDLCSNAYLPKQEFCFYNFLIKEFLAFFVPVSVVWLVFFFLESFLNDSLKLIVDFFHIWIVRRTN